MKLSAPKNITFYIAAVLESWGYWAKSFRSVSSQVFPSGWSFWVSFY